MFVDGEGAHLFSWYLDTWFEKWRIFVFSKRFLWFRVKVTVRVRVRAIRLRLGSQIAEIRLNTFSVKRPFGQTSIRTNVHSDKWTRSVFLQLRYFA